MNINLGDGADRWSHEETEDADSPLGRYLTDVSDADRVRLMAEPEKLFEFAKANIEDAFSIGDVIDKTLEQVRSRE